MATLQQNQYDKSKQTTTLPRQQQQQYQHQHNYDDGDEFYHIKKLCYQTTTAKISSTTKNVNQRKTFSTTTTTTPTTFTNNNNNVLLLLSNCRSLTFMLITYLLLFHHAITPTRAAPQSCILCDKNDLLAKDPQTNYEEFLFEHQVTRQDAINALRQLNESFYEGTASDSSCNAVRCTEKVMNYCLGPQFINDHCWCELGHSTEGLPFVPHICYVGEKIYKASVGSCFFYEEVKECCCSSVLAKEWRHISAASRIYSKTLFHDYYVFVIYFLYLLIRRTLY